MPDPNTVPPETALDVVFAIVGCISGAIATNMVSNLIRNVNKPSTSRWLIISLLFALFFTLVFAVVYRVFAGFDDPIPALPVSIIVGILLTLFMIAPMIGIHSFFFNLSKEKKNTGA